MTWVIDHAWHFALSMAGCLGAALVLVIWIACDRWGK